MELLQEAGRYLLPDEINKWFASRVLPGAANILESEGLTENQYRHESGALSRELRRIEIERQETHKAAPFKESLIEQANFWFHNQEYAKLWLNSIHMDLGKKPIDYCVDGERREYCVKLLKSAITRRRR